MNRIILKHIMEGMIDTLPLEHEANEIMQAEDFRQYVSQNGYHFTGKLADFVTKHHLKNMDGSTHNWTTEQVKAALKDEANPYHHTWGDAAYIANWIFSDNFPTPYKSDAEVLEATKRYLKDKDGYEGMVFMRWLSDLIGRRENVVWFDFM